MDLSNLADLFYLLWNEHVHGKRIAWLIAQFWLQFGYSSRNPPEFEEVPF